MPLRAALDQASARKAARRHDVDRTGPQRALITGAEALRTLDFDGGSTPCPPAILENPDYRPAGLSNWSRDPKGSDRIMTGSDGCPEDRKRMRIGSDPRSDDPSRIPRKPART